MVERTVTIVNRQGLHARPAAEIVKLTSKFDAEVTLVRDDLEVNGKSIMGLMMLAAGQGSKLKFTTIGEGGSDMIKEMEKLFERKFDEP